MRYLYLLRHGNPGEEADPKRCLGRTDVPLSDYGKRRIKKSAKYIKSYGWTKVYTSPLVRCLETAYCLGIDKADLSIKPDLCEMEAGIWENLTFDQIKREYPKLYEDRGKALGTFAVEGAESFFQAGERFEKALNQIREETKENILIITHAGVIRSFLCRLENRSLNYVMDYSIPYGSITILREEDGRLELEEEGLLTEELLDERERRRIYEKCQTPTHVVAHMEKVAEIAMECVKKREDIFSEKDRELLYAAALVHDIKRRENHHDRKGASFLRKEGYKRAAELVEMHHSPVKNEESILKLHEVLFYADKLVIEDKTVSLEERFEKSYEKCRGIKEAEEKHCQLYEKALHIEKKLNPEEKYLAH